MKQVAERGALFSSLALVLMLALVVSCTPPEITSAKLYINNDDWVNARAALEKALALYPDNAEAQKLMGDLEARQQNWEAAKSHWDRASMLSPLQKQVVDAQFESYWQNYYNDGFGYLQREDWENAESSFKVATILLPDRTPAWNNLAVVYGRQGLHEQAIEMYNKVLEYDPDDTRPRMAIGFMLYNQQKYQESIGYLEPLIDEFIDNSEFVQTLGFSYGNLQMSQEALDLYSRAIELDPENLINHMNLALLYRGQGDPEKAEPHFLKVIELNPYDAEAMTFLAFTYIDREEEEKALPYLEKASELDPSNWEIWYALGVYYVRKGAATGNQADITKGQEYMQKAETLRAMIGTEPPPGTPPPVL